MQTFNVIVIIFNFVIITAIVIKLYNYNLVYKAQSCNEDLFTATMSPLLILTITCLIQLSPATRYSDLDLYDDSENAREASTG